MNVILLSGGSGKRLWPLSNDIRSKQFIKIFEKEEGSGEYESMIQRVYRQLTSVDPEANVTIATARTQVSAIHNQLGDDVNISIEPTRRDTFPAIALATAYLHDVSEVSADDTVVVCPVDPYVDADYFKALFDLDELAKAGAREERPINITLMGIEPTSKPPNPTLPRVHSGTAVYLPIVSATFWKRAWSFWGLQIITSSMRATISSPRYPLIMRLWKRSPP